MLRIVSESGIGQGTRFIDTETGEDVSKMVPVSYGVTITIGEVVTAKCELALTPIDIAVGQTDFLAAHPITKNLEPVSCNEFRDGWRIVFLEDGTPRVQKTPTGDK